MSLGAPALAFAAGVLTVFSPCVLPILPIVLGAAAAEHRWGPAALAASSSGFFRGYWAVRSDHWLFDRAQHRTVP